MQNKSDNNSKYGVHAMQTTFFVCVSVRLNKQNTSRLKWETYTMHRSFAQEERRWTHPTTTVRQTKREQNTPLFSSTRDGTSLQKEKKRCQQEPDVL